MEIKNFKQYIKEDTSSVYDIEKPFTGDGDNLNTHDDESKEMSGKSKIGALKEISDAFSKLSNEALSAIIKGDVDIVDIAKTHIFKEFKEGGEMYMGYDGEDEDLDNE